MQINNLLKNPIKFHKRNPLAIVFNVWYLILSMFLVLSVFIGIYAKNLFDSVNNSVYEGNPNQIIRTDKDVSYEKINNIEKFFNNRKENFPSVNSIINTVGDPSL